MASLYDSASLVMLPSGVKESKVYSIKPTDGSGDFTFSRGTDTATRVNASGLIEKERGNLALQSNQFDTTWVTSNASVTGGQSGYDGSSDAWLLQNNAGFTTVANVRQDFSLSSAVRSFSVYAKAGNVNWLRILMYDGATTYVSWFNLTDGSASDESNIIDAKSTSVGGGWYRCEISANTNITSANIYPTIAAGSSFSDNGDSIYIQDAMLNQGLVAQPYIETTTAAVYEGITDNLPRLDYSGGASCPSLLLEPSRTNLLPYSELMSLTTYPSSYNITSVQNSSISPDGGTNAVTLSLTDTGLAYGYVDKLLTSQAAGTYTFSVFAKANTTDYAYLEIYVNGDATPSRNAYFNISSGSVESSSDCTASVEDYGSGWYRCIITTTTSSTSNIDFLFQPSNASSRNPTGNAIFYGAQAEVGSYVSSYIPTYGTAASRAADSCSKTGISSLIGQTEGTIYAELDWKGQTGAENMAIWMRSGATSYNEMIALFIGNNFKAQASVRSSSIQQVLLASDTLSDGIIKMAFAYKANDFAFYVNGVLVGTDTNGSVPTCDQIYLGGYPDGGARRGNNKQTLLFKTRLTNAELAALTA